MKVLHLLSSGGIGGIEILCKDINLNSDWENYFCFLFKGGEILEEIKHNNSNVIEIYKERGGILKKVKLIEDICKKEKIDIICIHHAGVKIQVYYLLLKKFLPNIKYVKFLHSVFEKKYYYNKNIITNNINKYLLYRALKISDKIIAVSYAVKRSFKDEFNIKNDKISVVYNGISNNIIKRGIENKLNMTNQFNLLYVGRIVDVKGIGLLIESMKQLTMESNVKLIIVGDGDDRKKYEKLVSMYKLENKIKFVGFQRNLNKFLMSANLFIYPSVWEEAFGISIVEAMAYGLPCVANRKGGIPEIIKSGKNGYITETDDIDGICNAINSIIKLYKSNKIQDMSKEAKTTAGEFCILNTIKNLKNEFVQLIE